MLDKHAEFPSQSLLWQVGVLSRQFLGLIAQKFFTSCHEKSTSEIKIYLNYRSVRRWGQGEGNLNLAECVVDVKRRTLNSASPS